MEKTAIIVAGGVGRRAGGDVPKQFHLVAGRPVLWWAMRAFHLEDPATRLVVALNFDFIELWNRQQASLPESALFPYELIGGGATRFQTVRNALTACGDGGLVAVHDAVRPLATPALIRRGWEAAEESGAAVPVVPLSDSIRHIGEDGRSVPVDRSRYVAVQTPQVFRTDLLRQAYSRGESPLFTDDASVAEAAGIPVATYQGDPINSKITWPADFIVADTILSLP